MNYESIIDEVIAREKGFSDHKNDSGGATKDGITEAVARAGRAQASALLSRMPTRCVWSLPSRRRR